MRRRDLPQPLPQARRRAAGRVIPGVIVSAAAVLVLTGCVGSGRSPTAIDRTITPTAEPTFASAPAPSTAAAPPTVPTSAPPPPAQGASGVEGTTVTSRCPVVTDPPCPTNPLTTHVVVTNGGGTVAAVDTGADGRFRFALRPGVYTITATAVPKGITRPATTTVTVVAGRFASLTLDIDSGIR